MAAARPSHDFGIEWLALTFDEIIEVVLGQPLIQSRVERVTGGRRKIRRRHPHFRLPLADAFSHEHVQSVVHEIESILSIRTREREGVMPITITQQTALITGASRGIGRGIALKLAEQGVKRIAINYKENDAAAEDAACLLKERGAAPLVIKADIGKVADIQRMFETIKSQFGGLDIFVSNARATLATGFYAEPMEIPLEAWQATFDTQATEFLVAVRAAVPMMGKNGRIIAITYAPGGQTGSWQPWVAMGSAKAAKEALARYFAVALAQKAPRPASRHRQRRGSPLH